MLKKMPLIISGVFLLICGIISILKNWGAIVIVFNAVYGVVLAVGGLIVLAFVRNDSN